MSIFFEFARRNLGRHKFRSVLAVVGIVIGVLALTALGILGNSIRLSVTEQLYLVGNELVVFPHGEPLISEKNFKTLERVADAIPVNSQADRAVLGSETGAVMIYGMRATDLPKLLDIADGQFFKHGSLNCVVGASLAAEYDLRVGERIIIREQKPRIVGILKERGIGFDINPDNAIIISEKLFSTLYEPEGYDFVIVRVEDIDKVEAVKEEIENRLNKKEEVVSVMEMKMIVESLKEFFRMVSVFLLGIGSISLAVAGVSILNVMMMSTVERTKEIGVMRAIGTSRRGILLMFLYESLILGAVGGVLGAMLGFGVGYLIDVWILGKASYLFTPSSVAYVFVGIAFGVGTSVFSGLYPAWRASRLKPIEALRFE
ncbi:ABC transporter permease [Candidatus Alkanophaga liquidiphilum]|nr:ABC-type transport system involved in lipoprotein release [Candidatus Alkanophaga liquidiphilum]RLG39027.1 MAG: ABC transporter permease [Candidatus Alkanophagales archaeon]